MKATKPQLPLRALIYDHDILKTQQTASWFRLSGQSVDTCAHYDGFLDLLEKNIYDVVIFDINSDDNGEDSFHAIKVHRACAPTSLTNFILYTDKSYASFTDDINATRVAGIIHKTGLNSSGIFFSTLANMLSFSPKLAQLWLNTYENKIIKKASNVVQFKVS